MSPLTSPLQLQSAVKNHRSALKKAQAIRSLMDYYESAEDRDETADVDLMIQLSDRAHRGYFGVAAE